MKGRRQGVKDCKKGKEIKIPAYLIGLLCTCFGVALLLKTNWGLDAWNGVFAGLEKLTHFSFGVWSIIIQGAFFLIAAVLDKKIEWRCIFPIIYKGIFLDAAKAAMSILPDPSGFMGNSLFFLSGYLIVAFGTGLYVATGYPKMPIDGLMTALSKIFAGSIKKSRLLIEVTGFILLIFVRGPFGIGTIIITFTIGYFISASRNITGKWLEQRI